MPSVSRDPSRLSAAPAAEAGWISGEDTAVCKSAIGPLWDRLADSGYLNRLSGLKPLEMMPIADVSPARYRVKTRAGGFRLEWEEEPCEWVLHQRYRILRRVVVGPIKTLCTELNFRARSDGGTDVKVKVSIEPKIFLIRPFARLNSARAARDLCRTIASVDAAIFAGQPMPGLGPMPVSDALSRAKVALVEAGSPEALVDRLADQVMTARDEDLQRIRPYELADAWGADRQAVLTLCLRAVRAGLLELRWEPVCPSCRVGTGKVSTLSALSERGSCHLCDLEFALNVEDAIEATFTPNQAVRHVDVQPYCVGGPARVPHVVAQAILPAHGQADLIAPTQAGRYRLFRRGGLATEVNVTDGEAPGEVSLDLGTLDGDAAQQTPLLLHSGGVVHVGSDDDHGTHIKLERSHVPSTAATAGAVAAIPGFRRDFSSEVLRPDMSVQIRRVAIFFSDLTASTQLYSSVGDAAALKLVHDHFDVVIGIIERCGGTLVKTIGDAVMAAFADELGAARAGLAILAAWSPWVEGHPHRALTHIKLGTYAGPCYLVNANDVLDYFGQTVNIAARLQAQAESGEMVVSAALCDLALEQQLIQPAQIRQRYTATLKGVALPLDVARIIV